VLNQTSQTYGTVASPGFVPIYSGGTARACTLFPYSGVTMASTIGESRKICQVQ
jgi:hypothetical protein